MNRIVELNQKEIEAVAGSFDLKKELQELRQKIAGLDSSEIVTILVFMNFAAGYLQHVLYYSRNEV
ncbi:MAG TPA: hypothetical protein DEA62_04350 [Coxiellaceae bacterium]|nr:MAG: hypothetical protein A2V89_01070 [Gammaproteobacteria bacterium RBG_16_37_9]HBC71332.1 hypothetical protein [Coxiellaceae bacterium]HBS52194.1 hypothetical protein [Coxiellaceae bacterium]HBY56219.1 hypothetical protein [Coxiellaceae bacterium]